MPGGVSGGSQQAVAEALGASGSSFWLVFKPFDCFQPGGVVIFIVHRLKPKGGGVALQFLPPGFIFISRDDVGVAEEYAGAQAFPDHPFQDCARAWGAAAMQEYALVPEVRSFGKFRKVKEFCT